MLPAPLKGELPARCQKKLFLVEIHLKVVLVFHTPLFVMEMLNVASNKDKMPRCVLFISNQGCISCGTCSYLELTEDHVLTSAYVKIFRIVTRNAVNKSF